MPLGSAVDQRPRIPCLSKRRGAGGCSNTLSDQPGRPGRGVSRLFKAWVCPRGHRLFKRLFFDLCAPLAVHMSQRAIVGSTRRQGLPAKSPPQARFVQRAFGKRSASGRRRGRCGQGGADAGACGQRLALSTCAQEGRLVHSQHRHDRGAPPTLRPTGPLRSSRTTICYQFNSLNILFVC